MATWAKPALSLGEVATTATATTATTAPSIYQGQKAFDWGVCEEVPPNRGH